MNWIEQAVAEMVTQGLIEEVEPGVYQKIDGHGWKLDTNNMGFVGEGELSTADLANLKVALLSVMESPETMGNPL